MKAGNRHRTDEVSTLVMPTFEQKPKLSVGKRDNSVRCLLGNVNRTDVSCKLWTIYPLTTTEFDPVITREAAVCILDVPGIRLLIIGPDTMGTDRVEEFGIVCEGRRVLVDNVVCTYTEENICRSDPRPWGVQTAPTIPNY